MKTFQAMPKTPSEAGLLAVKLKRKLEYKTSTMKLLLNQNGSAGQLVISKVQEIHITNSSMKLTPLKLDVKSMIQMALLSFFQQMRIQKLKKIQE